MPFISDLANYSLEGMPLVNGLVEVVEEGDPLAGAQNEHIGKIKLFAWRGPEYIFDPATDVAGVGWILAENWWPYQRPSFVTPPFAGYVSGHSTFSRAAAEIMTLLTGDEFFPGGMAEFEAKKNEFLVFEDGPSIDVVLQWAKYYDASDQCSLSRIWGGIHPPVDDIPGRLLGSNVGKKAFSFAEKYFHGSIITGLENERLDQIVLYPNPVLGDQIRMKLDHKFQNQRCSVSLTDMYGQKLMQKGYIQKGNHILIEIGQLSTGVYLLNVRSKNVDQTFKLLVK
ncbi:MAG: T9SS type A sorting domain-containing protein [Cyclobacteriaceae bacterium]|nr:T9SS type A sorting domain-containing protein [Cyclobacteriaceae bacterium]